MKARPFLPCRWDGTVRKMFLDELFPAGALFITPIQPKVDGKAYGTTHVGAGHRIVREGIRTIAMIIMAIDIVKQTARMLAQRVIKNQERVRFRTAHRFRLLEQILDAPIIDAVLEPRRFGEKAGEIGFVRTLQHAAGNVGQAFVVEDDQAGQVILEMVKLAPILKEIPK